MDVNQNYVQILVDTLEKKKGILSKILAVTKEQADLASMEQFDEKQLEKTLDEKEDLINRLNEADNGFDVIYERVRSEIIKNQGVYAKAIQKMQSLIKTCTEIGMEIQVLEERNRGKFAITFSSKRQEYKQVRVNTSAATNYYKTMSKTHVVDSYFLDQKK